MYYSSVFVPSLYELDLKCVKDGFPLSRNFYVPAGVNLTGFTRVNKIRDDV